MSADRARIEAIAVFPLPGLVLFPGALVPLHIFEPRYRALVRDCLDGARRLCLAGSRSTGCNAYGQPCLYPVAGLGEIIHQEQFADGRYDIVVLGRQRVELYERPFVPPYRIADARPLVEPACRLEPGALEALLSVARTMAGLVRQTHPDFELPLPAGEEASRLIDLVTHHLVLDRGIRQRLLETLDVSQRLQLCLDTLLEQCSVSRSGRESN